VRLPKRSLPLTLGLVVSTMALGITVRFAHADLPIGVSKYGGSALWAILVYWLVSAIVAGPRIVTPAAATAVLTAGVEAFKLFHAQGLDAFRLTLAGKLFLGRVFSVWDIGVYWLAIAAAAWIDNSIRGHGNDGDERASNYNRDRSG